jgi:3',5'-cyclic AMP phosphodiesterase CpdA
MLDVGRFGAVSSSNVNDAVEPAEGGRSIPELTTVGPEFAVVHTGTSVQRFDGLTPGTDHDLGGFRFRTLPDLGPQLARFTTVNDVHYGEQVAGLIEGSDIGPVFTSPPDAPHADVMSAAAIAEMAPLDPDLVVVKGDLTSNATQDELDRFLAAYGGAFGDRLLYVRGNHESYHHVTFANDPWQRRDLPGATVVLLDTSIDGEVAGTVTDDQLAYLDDLAAHADRPILLFGHHPIGDRDSSDKSDRTFGIDPDRSDLLRALIARRPAIALYSAGHTHRNRVRRFPITGDVPFGEVGSVKDYPGAWAEYRIHEGGIHQIVHRISSPEALAWTEQTRHMFAGLFADYAFGDLDDRCFTITPRPLHPSGSVADPETDRS